jgi:formate hydrogenlyase subunit 4
MMFSALAALGVVLLFAPAMLGIITRTKSFLTGRRGAPVLQLYADLWKLAHKGVVYSTTTTWIFRAGPIVVLATLIIALLFVPLDGRHALAHFGGDLVAFAALLALGRFALVLAGLDTGSSFEGMGASREVMVATFAEPALFLCFIGLVLATGDLSLDGMFGIPLAAAWARGAASLTLVGLSLFIVLLAENARVPVDDPTTHLELTMIHEVIVLDHSGPDFALVLYGSALKLTVFAALLVCLFLPRTAMPPALSIGVLVLGLAAVAVVVGLVESLMARLRLSRIPQLLVGASALAAFGIILLLR